MKEEKKVDDEDDDDEGRDVTFFLALVKSFLVNSKFGRIHFCLFLV